MNDLAQAQEALQHALAEQLAPQVAPGEEIGVVYVRPDGSRADLVISSCAQVTDRRTRARTFGLFDIESGQLVELYTTTHCDSGCLLASVGSRDVLVL